MIPSVRRTLLPVVLAAATFALPAVAQAKPSPRGKVCAGASAKLRPSPLRACVRVRKAPKALPSAVVKRDAVVKAKRRRAQGSGAGFMMG